MILGTENGVLASLAFEAEKIDLDEVESENEEA